MSDSNSYDNTGKLYNVSKILTPEFTLDEEKYKVGFVPIPFNFAVTYHHQGILSTISLNNFRYDIWSIVCRNCCCNISHYLVSW